MVSSLQARGSSLGPPIFADGPRLWRRIHRGSPDLLLGLEDVLRPLRVGVGDHAGDHQVRNHLCLLVEGILATSGGCRDQASS